MKRMLFFSLLCSSLINSTEYLYPVAIHNSEQIYVLYQKSTDHIELWEWNSVTKKASKPLLSTFTPAGIQLLPDGSGFSFVDHDRIRVKSYSKRQPKALEFQEPVYDISLIHWINGESFYFSAKEKERYSIFHGTIYGTCHRIVASKQDDYMYPQRVGNELYYIERGEDNEYAIASVPYPAIPHDECAPCDDPEKFEERVKEIMEGKTELHRSYADLSQKTVLSYFENHPIAFLQMISDSFGFVIEHPAHINRSDAIIPFTCHSLERTNDEWRSEALFSFDIPASLLVAGSTERLYESILPLLVRYDGHESLFFTNANKIGSDLNVYRYRLTDREVLKKSHSDERDSMFFSPFCSKYGNWYGGAISASDEPLVDYVCMWFDHDGDVCFNLPSVSE